MPLSDQARNCFSMNGTDSPPSGKNQRLLLSLEPQRHHRINLRRPPRRAVASKQRHAEHKYCHCRHRQRVARADAVKLTRHYLSEQQRSRHADQDSGDRQPQPFTDHEVEDSSPVRAKRNANSKFVRASAHLIRNHAVDACRRE